MNREQERKYLEGSPEVAAYLSHMGLRPASDGFRFLLFVINQLRRGTPFPNTYWGVTALYFGVEEKYLMRAIQNEIDAAYLSEPGRFRAFTNPNLVGRAPDVDTFLNQAMRDLN